MFFYIVLTPISTTSGLWSTGNTRKYLQIDVYIYQCEIEKYIFVDHDIRPYDTHTSPGKLLKIDFSKTSSLYFYVF